MKRKIEISDKLISKTKLIKKECFELNDSHIQYQLTIVQWSAGHSKLAYKTIENSNCRIEASANCKNQTIIEPSTPTSKYDGNLLSSSNTDTEMTKYTRKQMNNQGESIQMKSELQRKEELLNEHGHGQLVFI